MRRHRQRRRKGLRCLTIQLRETEVLALIRTGFLKAEARHDKVGVTNAFHKFLDQIFDKIR
jgi:hypothetical protein